MLTLIRSFLLLAVFTLVSCGPGRYVATIKAPPAPRLAEYAGDVSAMIATLEQVKGDSEAAGLLDGMDEILALTRQGLVAVTVKIADGTAEIAEGLPEGWTPTLVIPVSQANLDHLAESVADGELTDEEIFRIAFIVWKPAAERIQSMDYFTQPGDKTPFRIDNFMHFKLKNEERFSFHGETVEVAVTVLNVDGWFFYLNGAVGDPDIVYEFTLEQALQLYPMMTYDAAAVADNPAEAGDLIASAREIFESAIVYERGTR